MPLGNPQGGFGYAPEFQSSALPWITSSVAPASPNPVCFKFAMVTRFITVTNLDATHQLQLGVTYNGMKSTVQNCVTLATGSSLTLEWRCTKVFLQGSGGTAAFSLAVGLTTIPVQNFPLLTGSAADGTNWPGVG
jgi:hypothetical protein